MRIGGGKNATLSIPRDTVVNIPGHGQDKINAAYAIGGPALARTRKNECSAKDNDFSRARRQQKILSAIKGKVTSLETFVRLPWVSWAAPKAVRSDMAGPSLLGLVGAELTSGSSTPHVLTPTGVSGVTGLT